MRVLAFVVAALLFGSALVLSVRFGFGAEPAIYWLVLLALGYAGLEDMSDRKVPDWVPVALIVLWIALLVTMDCGMLPGELGHTFAGLLGYGKVAMLVDGIVGGVCISVGTSLLSLRTEQRTGHVAFNSSDVLLLFCAGLFLGLAGSLSMLLIACIISLALAFIWHYVLKRLGSDKELDDETFFSMTIPFAPSIAFAVGFCLVLGPLTFF